MLPAITTYLAGTATMVGMTSDELLCRWAETKLDLPKGSVTSVDAETHGEVWLSDITMESGPGIEVTAHVGGRDTRFIGDYSDATDMIREVAEFATSTLVQPDES